MPARLHRWDEIALEKITELMSQKIVAGVHQMLAQTYLKQGALVPMHAHASEQMTYVLQGALKFRVEDEEIIVREGEVLHIPANARHQAEALDDTFQLDVYSPPREDWLRNAEEDSGPEASVERECFDPRAGGKAGFHRARGHVHNRDGAVAVVRYERGLAVLGERHAERVASHRHHELPAVQVRRVEHIQQVHADGRREQARAVGRVLQAEGAAAGDFIELDDVDHLSVFVSMTRMFGSP
jgi:quercetin dioxygenase-like cupin family protein